MHETAVAQSLIKTILDEAARQKAKPVTAKISCGVLNAINDELVNFAFEAIAKGTACQGMKLDIEHKPIKGKCKNCGAVFEFEVFNPNCNKCGSEDFQLFPDEPLVLEEIEFRA
ncbi:MAG: hydrogenase maturation nickel metallochaperone HypA [Sedimentisphaerales bacterium]|nr:hydrogenase maturation nickel metallochaperone HypA [Sedimentisphaerales bacterium]